MFKVLLATETGELQRVRSEGASSFDEDGMEDEEEEMSPRYEWTAGGTESEEWLSAAAMESLIGKGVRSRRQRAQLELARRRTTVQQGPPPTSWTDILLMLSMWLASMFVLLRLLPMVMEERWHAAFPKTVEHAVQAMCIPFTGLAFFAVYEKLYMGSGPQDTALR